VGTFYLTYNFAEKRDLCSFEAFTTVFLNVAVSTVGAFIINLVTDEGLKLFAGERGLIDVMQDLKLVEDLLDGMIVFNDSFEPVFCTRKALLILKVREDRDVPTV